jgi:hypothetical protein
MSRRTPSQRPPSARTAAAVCVAASTLLGGLSAPARAAPPAAADAPGSNTVINLIQLMVKRGLLSTQEAADLVRQAETEAAAARAAEAAPAVSATPAPPADLPAGSVFVPYVPESVRNQLREEIKADVMEKARVEKWAAPGATPTWTQRITIGGDLRARDEYRLYDSGNTGTAFDFAAWNEDGPTDVNPDTNPELVPFLNTREDRNNILRARARLNVAAKISDEVSAQLRLASGSDGSPVSTNQTLGGGLSKKELWLDRAAITIKPDERYRVTLGRLSNPFMATDLIYDEDLGFDGLALGVDQALREDGERALRLFGRAGVFSIGIGSNDAPQNSPVKQSDHNQWLYGAQLGVDWKLSERQQLKAALAYYDYDKLQGELSEPCELFSGLTACSTDQTRPPFMQKGNTVFFLRNIATDPNNPAQTALPQFVGLSHDYNLLALTLHYDLDLPGSWRHFSAQGEYVTNLGFDRDEAFGDPATTLDDPLNNYGASADPLLLGPYESGDSAWMLKLVLGEPTPSYSRAWNLMAAYKYIEADAVLDAFTDSDFHLGGSNARGYVLGGGLGLYSNTWLSARWFSANEVSGPPLGIDVLQIDLNVRF